MAFRYRPDAAREIFGFDEAHPIAELDRFLPELAADRPALYTPLGLFAAWDQKISGVLNEVRKRCAPALPRRKRSSTCGR
jgi:Xaa-Pro aminopeptidase